MEHDHAIDISGLCCAQPIIRITQELKQLATGNVLLVKSDKVSIGKDIPAYCKQTGNNLVHQEEHQGVFRFWIQKNR
ncbi:MAG: sulfurtransferase TusA family protein [Burkholderiales bacterium]